MSARERIIKMAEELPKGPVHYAQIRPYSLLPRRKWWHDMDCSGTPLARRIFTFMEWYDARGGKA